MKHLQLRLPEELLEELRKVAAEQRRSMHSVILFAIEREIQRHDQERQHGK